jgi:hypothetical protein
VGQRATEVMWECPLLSRQGLSTIAHRFIGGSRYAPGMQPRQGRQNSTQHPVLIINDLGKNPQLLPSLMGLIGSAALTTTVETVGYCRVSLAEQRPGDLDTRNPSC